MPLVRELGAGRVPLELAEEFRRLGHSVETFDYRDAFPGVSMARWHDLLPLRFAKRAAAFVRAHAGSFDVIDALLGDLPFEKQRLGFDGLLVARSTGLYGLYRQYVEYERAVWRHRLPGTPAGRCLSRWAQRRAFAACERSLRAADLVNLLNQDEHDYVQRALGLGHRCVVFPNGLSGSHAGRLGATAGAPAVRLQRKEVAVIGSWTLRKGVADWAEIVRRTRALVPAARFRFLGTGTGAAEVLADLELPASEWVSVVPSYRSEELPGLLSHLTVGALPSYMDGWGLGVLEQMAAGLPTVAYDVPGPRAMLGQLDPDLLVAPGDVARFSQRLAELLALPLPSYERLAARCRLVSQRFLWPAIASSTLTSYTEALARLCAGVDGLVQTVV